MAKSSSALLSLSLSFLLLFNGCFGRQSFQQSPNECQLNQINAIEPTIRIEAEGGVTEFWDPNDDQFRCGGAHLFRHIIQPKGLLLPSYTNAPLIAYVLQGSGEFGIVIPGCAETYQSFQQSYLDRHQKIGSYRQGDILVFPESAAHWLYNSGQQQTILVVLQDTSNDANQLDANPLRFFLAGSSQESQSQGQSSRGQRQQGQQQHGSQQGQEGQEQGQQQQHSSRQQQQQSSSSQRLQERLGYNGNILAGLDVEIVRDALNTDMETAQKIVRERSQERGHIITVEKDLQLIVPTEQRRQSSRGSGSSNGLEETVCSARVRQNIDNPERADFYDPQAGRVTTLNRFTLPIFQYVQLSAARGFLNRNWGIVPKWSMNAHSFVYVTRGSAQVQIVNHNGDTVLDQEVREGQMFLVPQDYVVVKQAGEQGFEWVEFITNDNAMFNTLSGRTSTLAGLPTDIIVASYDLSRSKAQSLKRNMISTLFFQASSSGGSRKSGRAFM